MAFNKIFQRRRQLLVLFLFLLCTIFIFKFEIRGFISLQPTIKLTSSISISNDKILCLILTHDETLYSRSSTVWKTWAHKCHKALFTVNSKNSESMLQLPLMSINYTESYENMAEKVFLVLKKAFDEYENDYKWFLLVDDDTFIFMDNLKSFISNRSFNEPVTYGYNFKVIVPSGYHSGGGGVLLTHEALKRISRNINLGICNEKNGYGDVALGTKKMIFSYSNEC